MLRTGNKAHRKKLGKGFTLLEVMITTCVLALGATLIYQSFFIALDSYNYYSILLKITPWMDEKVWEAQDDLRRLGPAGAAFGGGRLDLYDKEIDWDLSSDSLDQDGFLYRISLVLSWPQGKRQIRLSRSAYALYAGK
jgi:prepilin-type N-terminal cleavage/methylation domain-containing protein